MALDLRRNGGGDLGTVTLVLDWLLGGEPTYICDAVYRDRTRRVQHVRRVPAVGVLACAFMPSIC